MTSEDHRQSSSRSKQSEFESHLVDEASISNDAHRVDLALATHDVAGGDAAAIGAILGARPVRLAGNKLRRACDLASLDARELGWVLGEAEVPPPAGMTLPDYADKLAGRIGARFPTEALLRRVTTLPDDFVASLARAVGLKCGAPRDHVVGNSAPPGRDAVSQGPDPLRLFVNLHPGLRLGEVIEIASDAESALSTISTRVGWVERVLTLNSDLDLLAVDYAPESPSLAEVEFDGLSAEERSMVIENLKAYQRIQSTGAGAADGIKLLQAGYRSATEIAESLPSEIAVRSGLTLAEARGYHAMAVTQGDRGSVRWDRPPRS
ncbi:MAG: hypothetical protein KJ048_01815 [Dehalococcoidia bacterium]|nr:hypothetical protein [Dehalococcoidia bacterium]